jgi:hypothetical protein
MYVPFHDGVISQFSGYDAPRGVRLGRLPRALRRHRTGSTGSSRPRGTRRTATSSPSRPTCSCSSTCCPGDELRGSPHRAGLRVGTRSSSARTRRLLPARTVARLDAVEHGQLLGAVPHRPGELVGVLHVGRWRATSPTSRAARPRRASTSARWRARWTWCSAATAASQTARGARRAALHAALPRAARAGGHHPAGAAARDEAGTRRTDPGGRRRRSRGAGGGGLPAAPPAPGRSPHDGSAERLSPLAEGGAVSPRRRLPAR